MCHLLGLRAHTVGTDTSGRIDLDEVEALASAGLIGTVVVTAGTTGLGAVDRVEGAVALKDRYGLRVHVDGAYGGFFAVLAKDTAASGLLGLDPRPWSAIAECDSFVVDPHKHGLQPYGCGAVLFSDPSVARHYAHDSPYTYFTGGGAAHLGEISLECSRAGAAAAAFWLTLRLFPLTTSGLGRVLAATRRAASSFARLLEASEELCLYQEPELDIVAYFASLASPAELDAVSEELLSRAMTASDPVFLSTLRVKASDLARRHPSFSGMQEQDDLRVRILRSVLMKPESEAFVPALMGRLESLVAELVD